MGFEIVFYQDKPLEPVCARKALSVNSCYRPEQIYAPSTLFSKIDDWGQGHLYSRDHFGNQMAMAYGYRDIDSDRFSKCQFRLGQCYQSQQSELLRLIRDTPRSFSWGADWSTLDWPTRLKIFQEIEKAFAGRPCQMLITLNSEGDVDHFKQNGGYTFCLTTSPPEARPIPPCHTKRPYGGGDIFYIHRTVGYKVFYISASFVSWSIRNQVNVQNCISIRYDSENYTYYVGAIQYDGQGMDSRGFGEQILNSHDHKPLLTYVKTQEYPAEGRIVDMSDPLSSLLLFSYSNVYRSAPIVSKIIYRAISAAADTRRKKVSSPNNEVIFHVGGGVTDIKYVKSKPWFLRKCSFKYLIAFTIELR